jgi:hypothetical protein
MIRVEYNGLPNCVKTHRSVKPFRYVETRRITNLGICKNDVRVGLAIGILSGDVFSVMDCDDKDSNRAGIWDVTPSE